MSDKKNIVSPTFKGSVYVADMPCRHFCRKISLVMRKIAPKNCLLLKPFDVSHNDLMAAFFAFRFEKPEVLRILSIFEKNSVIRRRSTRSWTILNFSIFENTDTFVRFFMRVDSFQEVGRIDAGRENISYVSNGPNVPNDSRHVDLPEGKKKTGIPSVGQ